MRSLIAHGWVHHRSTHPPRTPTTNIAHGWVHHESRTFPRKSPNHNIDKLHKIGRVIPKPLPIRYPHRVPTGLKRYGTEGDDHLITFSCFHCLPYLADKNTKDIFEATLEKIRQRHRFRVHGYVVMPEHVHILLSEPDSTRLATALNVLKTQTSRQLKGDRKQFWQTRYHDVNILTHRRWRNALHYIHGNPVKANLVAHPEAWPWSSYIHWLTGEPGRFEIESHWTWNQCQQNDSALSRDPPIA